MLDLNLYLTNDTSHTKFTTSGSGELDIKAEKFFIGTPGSQFISGSGGAIEISSSDFHLDPVSNQLVIGTGATIKSSLTVNQIRTPAIVNGAPSTKANASSSIDQDGFARFASASIAGFEVVSSEIRSSDRALRLKAAGDITASRVLLEGGTITDGVTILGSVTKIVLELQQKSQEILQQKQMHHHLLELMVLQDSYQIYWWVGYYYFFH